MTLPTPLENPRFTYLGCCPSAAGKPPVFGQDPISSFAAPAALPEIGSPSHQQPHHCWPGRGVVRTVVNLLVAVRSGRSHYLAEHFHIKTHSTMDVHVAGTPYGRLPACYTFVVGWESTVRDLQGSYCM